MQRHLPGVEKTLKHVIPTKDLIRVKELLTNYFESLGPETDSKISDYNKLKSIKNELFEYEKKYLPFIEENKKVYEEFKPDILILTVGLQAEPLILSILCLKPKKVILLHSSESIEVARSVKSDSNVRELNPEISFVEITEFDSLENYNIIKRLFDRISEKEKILVDPTGGRKMMNSSLSLAAFYFRLLMVYMYVKEIKRNTIPFTSKIKIIENPFEIYGDIELSSVEKLFNSHFYEAAVKTCESLEKTVKDPATAKKIELLKEMISIYRDWDAFKHSIVSNRREDKTLSERLEEVLKDFNRFRINKWLPENIDRNIKFLKEIDSRWRPNSDNLVDEFRLVDIYLSALRRGSEKQAKYDDAIARLYRCLEISASLKLLNMGLKSTKSPDYEKFAKKSGVTVKDLKEKYTKLNRGELPSHYLGLDVQMNILKVLNEKDPIVAIYEEMSKETVGNESVPLIKMRNSSILAHGTYPATENDWAAFRNKTKAVIISLLSEEGFKEILNKGMHGKIKLNNMS